MTSPEIAYERYITKAEKNGVNNNIATDRGRFVLLYNELKNRVVKWYLKNRQLADIEDIQVLLVDDKPIAPLSPKHLDHVHFKLPDDYFAYSFARAVGGKDGCYKEDISLYDIRDEDRGNLTNTFYEPSWLYRECPYVIGDNKIKVFIEDGMYLDKVYLSYYRYANEIKLINENDPESQFDNSSQIELPDEVLDRIISSMVGDFKINNENQSFQFDKLREKENLIVQ